MQHTKIEWVKNEDGSQGYTINPIKGLCPVDCKDNLGKSYCYARRMYKRFGWNPEIRFRPGEFIMLPSKSSRVFIGSTMELFGEWVDPEWMQLIFEAIKVRPQHTFLFLTKQPENLLQCSPFPDNCWVGASVTGMDETGYLIPFCEVEARLKFLSIEPLFAPLCGNRSEIIKAMLELTRCKWVIIGSQTPYSPKTAPKKEWVNEIVEACNEVNIPIFIKNNLKPLLGVNPTQDFPHVP